MPSYLVYKRQMAVLDADDIEWITVKGNHIPIKKGENKEEAIKSFFESKGKTQKSPEKAESKSEGISSNTSSVKSPKNDYSTVKSILGVAKRSKENKNINAESVIKDAVAFGKFNEKEIKARQKSYEKYKAKGVKQTIEIHTTGGHWEDGDYVDYRWNPERLKLQDKIIEEVSFGNIKDKLPKKGEKPKLVLIGGRGGSGKSKFTYENENKNVLGEYGYSKKNFVVIDPDEYKERLPEYKDLVDKGSEFAGLNAWEVHEESSSMKKRALDRALELGANVVLDGTLAKYGSAKRTLDKFREKDYIIDVAFMELPREKSAVRGINRGMRKNDSGQSVGRWVPIDVMLGMTDCEENFDKLSKDADNWVMFHNDVGKDDNPQFVAKGGKK